MDDLMMELDCRRLLCPMPVIKVQDQIAQLPDGAELKAVGTDPGMVHDVPAWCRINGHQVLKIEEKDGEYIIHIKVKHD